LNVDHIVPARLFSDPSEADDPKNLASLCTACHAIKTHHVERLLLKGDVSALDAFYGIAIRAAAMRRMERSCPIAAKALGL
jgi:hypothetical protein